MRTALDSPGGVIACAVGFGPNVKALLLVLLVMRPARDRQTVIEQRSENDGRSDQR